MRGRAEAGFTLIELMIVIAIVAVITAIAIPNILAARKNANEAAAIGGLKTIANAQQLFREADKDNDGDYDFSTLAQLSNTNLIDTTLGGGTRTGYTFETGPSTTTPSFLWFAMSNPVSPTATGDRYFCSNNRGQIFYTTVTSITPNYTTCDIATTMLLVR